MADLTKKQEVRKLNGKVVSMFPSTLRSSIDKENGLVATCVLSSEEIVQSIEEWRQVWPELANDPKLKEHYDGICEAHKKKLETKRAESA